MKKMHERNEKGFALLVVLMFFLTAAYGLTSLLGMGGSHARTVRDNVESSKAFYLTESAVERAKITLRDNFQGTPIQQSGNFNYGDGQFYYDIANSPDGDATKRVITGVGAYPSINSPVTSRAIKAVVQKPLGLPNNFWDYAIYSAGEIEAKGNSYTVTGDVIAGDGINYSHDHISGSETVDPSIHPLAALNYEQLKALAQSQVYNGHDNYYTASEIGVVPYPTSFYYSAPSPSNPLGTPNVVFIEGNLVLNGNFGTVGGFLVVVGSILTDPNATADTTLNGNGTVDGVVYTLGDMTVNGGGGNLNVLGGVFAADEVTLNGHTNVTYNQTYMNSIKNINPDPGMTVLSWNEVASPIQ